MGSIDEMGDNSQSFILNENNEYQTEQIRREPMKTIEMVEDAPPPKPIELLRISIELGSENKVISVMQG